MRPSKIFLLLCLFTFCVGSYAQTTKKPQFNLGISAGTSDALHGFNPGADLRLAMPGSKDLSFALLISAGYTHLDGKYMARYVKANSISEITYAYVDLLSLKAGIKYFPARNFYIAADAGIAFPAGSKIEDATFMTIVGPDSTSISKTGSAPSLRSDFVYSPSVGITPGKHWDLSVKYESFIRYNRQFAFRIGYNL